MKKTALIISLIILVLAVSCSSDPYAENRKYHLITVGNDYTQCSANDLAYTVYDAIQVGYCFKDILGDNIDVQYLLGYNSSYRTACGFSEECPAPSWEKLQSAVATVKAEAKAQDITILYLSGHGSSSQEETSYDTGFTSEHYAVLTSTDGSSLDYKELEDIYSLLDTIPGTKLIIADFCYSGGFIEPNGITADSSLYSDTDVLSILFSGDINVDHPSVYALTASSYYTESQEYASLRHGVFTYALLRAFGWNDSDLANPTRGSIQCSSGDEVTLSSLYNWIYRNGGVTTTQRPVQSSTSADLVLLNL